MRLLDVERRLERVERLLRAAADEARSARMDLGNDNGGNERWAKMMFEVLQQLVEPGPNLTTRLTSEGRKRLRQLEGRYGQ